MSDKQEKAREAIEEAVLRAAEAGMTIDEVREEFDYAIQTSADEGAFGPGEPIRD